MKKQPTRKKLMLQRESVHAIRAVFDDVLAAAAGGGPAIRPRASWSPPTATHENDINC